MTAPALVLLAHGSTDPRIAGQLHELRRSMQQARPDLDVSLAFLDHCPPSGPAVVQALAKRGVKEMVFVPLELSSAVNVDQAAIDVVELLRHNHPSVSMQLARPVGPATDLLNVLDQRLREALRASGAGELDALVISVPQTGDARGNALLARRARQWGSHHRLPCLVAANDSPATDIAHAMSALRAQGRRHIAVGSLYVCGDQSFRLQRATALKAGAVAVSEPIGAHEVLLELVMARYAFAAMDLLDHAQLQDEATLSVAI
ncbi:sirohydrochlorin chelatase [Luteococcus sp.]|uniref:sirohydrochlorin chelatase n=1 Tax=Luteococcus sp. TaxID=1969402 RepID=UPI003734FB1A